NFLIGTSWVSEITGTPVTIYPNPFSDRVTLNGASGYEVTVTDMLGHIVARISDATDMESLVIPGAAGMYVVQLRSAAGTHSMMITKQ
ncbi:MAG: T9SS C-terminal target domain-containing protein, partial [Ignavibacteriae bacterium]